MTTREPCTVEDCGRARFGHGLCNKHYQRWRRSGNQGDPTARRYGGESARFQAVSVEDRFWTKVNLLNLNGCWTHSSAKNPSARGYAHVAVDGVYTAAHRWAYEYLVGPIPEGLTIDHLCRNTACVNPAHMEPVTASENTRRMRASRRADQAAPIPSSGSLI